MRGYTFLAVFLILAGLVMVIATMRGRAPEFLAAFTSQAQTTKKGTVKQR